MTERRQPVGKSREEGFALLLVLWTMGFLALLVSQVLATGRSALKLGDRAFVQAQLETATDAAITTELFEIATSGHAFTAVNADWHPMKGGDGTAEIRSRVERGKINPNMTTQAILQAFFLATGLPSDKALMLSEQVFAWRNAAQTGGSVSMEARSQAACISNDAPLRTLDDLSAVPGFTQSVVKLISPHMSFVQMQPPAAVGGDGIVRAALQRVGLGKDTPDDAGDEDTLLVVDARVTTPQGGAMQRHAEVILLPDARPVPWQVMRWETEALSP